MKYHRAKNVTIITESAIRDPVLKLLGELGIGGYTVTSVVGKGEHGLRDGDDITGLFASIKIETITSPELADAVIEQIIEKFFDNYAGIIFAHDVEVVRPKKFQLPQG